jgi:hypothetical protein
VLKIDPSKDAAELIGTSDLVRTGVVAAGADWEGWVSGGVLDPGSGCVFAMPVDAADILKVAAAEL